MYVKTEPFLGEGANVDFGKWARKSARSLETNGVSTELQISRILLSYIMGRAGIVRNSYYTELDNNIITEVENGKELIEYFSPKFQQANSEIASRQKLVDLKQTGLLEKYILVETNLVGSATIE
ncbi:hypothetical protein BB560_005872 [Smittium megazygosporum]|uniref:Uncharacterized protein n=1 Tax=Smittium megazygosporum TaxID=133381 RepID=A0A2T9YSC8_9FUNG|nr:hypothetical protein BB560_005872 [Smittium megazygosporum]